MEVGDDFVGMVKTNTKVLCKETIEKLTKDWSVVSYLMFRSNNMLPGGSLLLAIGYKYTVWKVISCIFTYKAGSKQAGLTYLSKCPDHFSNVYIIPVARPLVMYKLFGSVNEFDFHNKSRQSDLALDNFCVT